MRASEVPTRPVAELVPYARNSRTHSEAQIAQIAASIAEFGFTNPILAGSDGVIVAVRRWEEFTGKTATLEATGQTFQEVQDERRRQAAA